MEEPQLMLNYYIVHSPGTVKEISASLDIIVSAREDTYNSQFQSGYPLRPFVIDNHRSFPIKAVVSDWFQQSTITDNHEVSPGDALLFHRLHSQRKILVSSETTDTFFVIPRSYPAEFSVVPRTFNFISTIPRERGFRFRATEDVTFHSANIKQSRLQAGKYYAVKGTSAVHSDGKTVDLLSVYETMKDGSHPSTLLLHFPLHLGCKVHEVLSLPETLNLSDLNQNLDFPIQVIFTQPCHLFEVEVDPLQTGEVLTLEGEIHEDTALVSPVNSTKLGKAFNLPLRSEVNVTQARS